MKRCGYCRSSPRISSWLLFSTVWFLSRRSSSFAFSLPETPAYSSKRRIGRVATTASRYRGGATDLIQRNNGAKKATMSPDDDDMASKRTKAHASIVASYRAAAASAIVDSISLWSASKAPPSSVFVYVEVLWKFAWVVSLYLLSKTNSTQEIKPEDASQVIIAACNRISPLFRLAAWLIALAVVNDIVSLFQAAGSHAAIVPWIRRTVVSILAVSGLLVRGYSARETRTALLAARKNKNDQKMGSTVDDQTAETAQQAGFKVARNMALCATAHVVQGFVLVPTSLSQSSWAERIIMLTGVPTPIVTARLLMTLRYSVLAVVVAVTTTSSANKIDKRLEEELHDAQVGFYANLASVFRTEAGIKVIVGMVQWQKPMLQAS